MEKRNVVEPSRTPATTEKIAEVVDSGIHAFMLANKDQKKDLKEKTPCQKASPST